MKLTSFEALRRKLSAVEPPPGELRRASVAVILKEPKAPSVLLIKRAERSGDPWSGQIAFPGGKAQAGDVFLRGTAVRETREEVGVDLERDADFLGYFLRFTTHTKTMDVFPTVFLLNTEPALTPNEEVSSCKWVKLASLTEERAASAHVELQVENREMPALLVDDYLIWGLTLRILLSLLR
ncbi:MAG TPA: CoA pyrophosphatase [Nitrososphaerales archaeon]|nr:CoA pyrophosphatase [Nitrososphaerales archaeon]